MQQSIMAQGADLMLFGMGAVFVFLTLLVFCTRFMSWAVNRFFPEVEQPIVAMAPLPAAATASAEDVDPKILAAIHGAIGQHRAKRGA